jgi:DNA-binding MarR family transcriptional regulator
VLSLVNIAKNMVGDFLKKTPLSNIMEYQFLMVLRHHGRQSKSGIIDMNRMEMSSGIEIIRRLIKNGWALEEENPDDKRAKYIKITKGGEKLLDELEPAIASLYGFLGGGLEGEDRSRVEKALEELVSRLASR